MSWKKLLCKERLRESTCVKDEDSPDKRNAYQSDFGRVVFCPAVRRLHDKTQVFPLTSDDNIHSRLTHSMEVMNIGLSFAINLSGNENFKKHVGLDSFEVMTEVEPILKTACLVHDIGNPPFGHYGEVVIQGYFTKLFKDLKSEKTCNKIASLILDYVNDNKKKELEDLLNDHGLMSDYEEFDGNAEGFRVLTKLQYNGDLYGLNLTSATLASTLKYPNIGTANKEEGCPIEQHKHGVFFTERDYLETIAKKCGLNGEIVRRHPLAFLMEAADSICYLVMDLEDAFNKKWIKLDTIVDSIREVNSDLLKKEGDEEPLCESFVEVRTKLLGHLVQVATCNFLDNIDDIESGKCKKELIENDEVAKKLREICNSSVLNHREIVSLEMTGQAIITGLLDFYLENIFSGNKKVLKRIETMLSKSILHTVWHEHVSMFGGEIKDVKIDELTIEERLRVVRDFVACMTDKFALSHYQKLSGQKI